MSYFSKYNCVCGYDPCKCKTYGTSGCCSDQVQPAPAPCCESHNVICQTGVCFYPTCSIAATDGTFYLTFKNNDMGTVPLNANEVFFYHKAAGLMKITGFDGISYQVELVDPSRAGAVIESDDCVLVTVESDTGTTTLNTRCLYGTFVAPALNEDAEITILNGSGIPIGATLTFTANGETGSYLVKSFVSASGDLYVYTVTNTGSGHTPGTIIDAGCSGACTVPVEVLTDVDICNLSETETLDTISGCYNGSPRAMSPVGPGYMPVGSDDGSTWEQAKVATLDCCVILDGCLKFSGATCPGNTDSVVLRDVNLSCFEDAYQDAVNRDQNLPMNINGTNVTVVDYNSSTRVVTLSLAEDTTLPSLLEFSEGDQLCLGDCCSSCLIGPQLIDHKLIGEADFRDDAVIGVQTDITIPNGTSYWMLGLDDSGAAYSEQKDGAYFSAPSSFQIGLPKIDDPFIVKQKICNTSPFGCDQRATLYFNFKLDLNAISQNITCYWEVGHYAAAANTLANGDPNPFIFITTQNKESGVIQGPSAVDATLQGSSFGTGGPAQPKVYPFEARSFHDFIELRKCDCAMSVVWLFLRIVNASTEETATVSLDFRRAMDKFDRNIIPIPKNDPADDEGFAY